VNLPTDLTEVLPAWRAALPNLTRFVPEPALVRMRALTESVAENPSRATAGALLEAIYAEPEAFHAAISITWFVAHARAAAGWTALEVALRAAARVVRERGPGRVACEPGLVWIDGNLLMEGLYDLEVDPSGRWIGQEDDAPFADLPQSPNFRRRFHRILLNLLACEDEARNWLHNRGRILTMPAVGLPVQVLLTKPGGPELLHAITDTVMRHPTVASPAQRPWWTAGWSSDIAHVLPRLGAERAFSGFDPWERLGDLDETLEAGLFALGPHHSPDYNLTVALRHLAVSCLGEPDRDLSKGWTAYTYAAVTPATDSLPVIVLDDDPQRALYPLRNLVNDLASTEAIPASRTVTGGYAATVSSALAGGLAHLPLRDRIHLVTPALGSDPTNWYVSFAPKVHLELPPSWSLVPDQDIWDVYVDPHAFTCA
jgi:hypothetical protein